MKVFKRFFYYVAGPKYIKEKVRKNNELLDSDLHKKDPKKWKKIVNDQFDIMHVCIWKLQGNKELLKEIGDMTTKVIDEKFKA